MVIYGDSLHFPPPGVSYPYRVAKETSHYPLGLNPKIDELFNNIYKITIILMMLLMMVDDVVDDGCWLMVDG